MVRVFAEGIEFQTFLDGVAEGAGVNRGIPHRPGELVAFNVVLLLWPIFRGVS